MIRASQVRLVGVDGEQIGIMGPEEALDKAMDEGFDLVEISPNAKPPVCRIMDYGKYKYLMSKKAHESRKKQTVIHVKEVKLRIKTDEHDYQFKVRNVRRFLGQGDKVKVSLIFRGREITHPDLGINKLNRVAEEIKDLGTVEQMPKREGRQLNMIISPLAAKTPHGGTKDA